MVFAIGLVNSVFNTAEAKIENGLIRLQSVMNQLILNSIANSLVLSHHCSCALNLIVDRFEANNAMIYSHGFLYKQFSVSFYSGIR